MHLNPRQLEAFRAVMVTGSMTLAAEMMKISQPAVSRLIRDLEQTLQLRLFRREGNRLIPGAEAQRLFTEVDSFYQGMARVERVARDLNTVRTGTLRIASMHALGLSVVMEGVRLYSRDRPGVAVSVDVRHSLSILELASANQIDLGFVQIIGTEHPGVDIIPFPNMHAVCVLPSKHRLSRKKVIAISDLHGERLISLSRNSPLRMRIEMALDAEGVVCERPVETSLANAACSMVSGGLGLTLCDPFTATYSKYPGVVRRKVEPAIPFEFSMVLPAHQPRSKVVNDFMQVMNELFNKEILPQVGDGVTSRQRPRHRTQ